MTLTIKRTHKVKVRAQRKQSKQQMQRKITVKGPRIKVRVAGYLLPESGLPPEDRLRRSNVRYKELLCRAGDWAHYYTCTNFPGMPADVMEGVGTVIQQSLWEGLDKIHSAVKIFYTHLWHERLYENKLSPQAIENAIGLASQAWGAEESWGNPRRPYTDRPVDFAHYLRRLTGFSRARYSETSPCR